MSGIMASEVKMMQYLLHIIIVSNFIVSHLCTVYEAGYTCNSKGREERYLTHHKMSGYAHLLHQNITHD